MEVYLAAVISFITKPKRRLWQPDGIESLIEVIAPKVDERQYGKGYNQEEVQRRLSYLANLVDSHGWSVRGVADPNSSMRDDLYNEALAANDMLDEDNYYCPPDQYTGQSSRSQASPRHGTKDATISRNDPTLNRSR